MKNVLISIFTLVVVIIIGVFIWVPKMMDANLNPVADHRPFKISSRAQKLHDSLIIGDWHADTLLWSRNIAKKHYYGHVDLPRLQQGNVGLQMFTTVTKSPSGLNYDQNSAKSPDDITKLALVQRWPSDTWTSLTARALHQADKLHLIEQQNKDDLMIIKSVTDLENWLQQRKSNRKLVGGLLGTEGSHALDGKLENVEVLFDAGFRMMSLHHFFDNKLGGSLHGTSDAGLSEFGQLVVQRILELNIILDVSHSSEKTVRDVLALSKRPLVVSHTGFKGHCNTARNISDKLMQDIAKNGGVIAIGYWQGAVCGYNPKAIVNAIRYGISLIGEDHISLGSDFDGSITAGFDTSELAAITQEMLIQGLTESQIRKVMGENMLKLLQNQLPKA